MNVLAEGQTVRLYFDVFNATSRHFADRDVFRLQPADSGVFIVVSPYFLYQAIRYKKYIGSLRQRLGYLPVAFNVDGEESIWIHAVSVGEALTARALAADLKARYPRLRLFLSTTTIAGQQVARQQPPACRRRVLFSVRLGVHRPAHAQHREAARVHHDGDRDLAEPAATLPRARREDGRHQRTHLVALLPPLPDRSGHSSAASSPTSTASACRARNRRAGLIDLGADPSRVTVTAA